MTTKTKGEEHVVWEDSQIAEDLSERLAEWALYEPDVKVRFCAWSRGQDEARWNVHVRFPQQGFVDTQLKISWASLFTLPNMDVERSVQECAIRCVQAIIGEVP